MKKVIFLLMVIFLVSATILLSHDEDSEIVRSFTVEDFDGASAPQWTVRGSRFVDGEVLRSQIVSAWPKVLFGENPDEARRAFGIRGGFTRQGHNYIEIIPPGGSIELAGLVSELDLWAWGTNLDYYVTAQIQDYRGIYHTLEMGSIKHLGWRKLSARIPSSVPQLRDRPSNQPNITLIKLVLWTEPTERVGEFYVYFDELRSFGDLYKRRTDGSELSEPEFVEENWS